MAFVSSTGEADHDFMQQQRELKVNTEIVPFRVDGHETTFRVNVRWVTPLGEETASTS